MLLHDYNFMNEYNLKNHAGIEDENIQPYRTINILVKIVMSIRSFIANYDQTTILKDDFSSKISLGILDDLKKDDSFYYSTLKELVISKFSY